jgi:hypothetical protein
MTNDDSSNTFLAAATPALFIPLVGADFRVWLGADWLDLRLSVVQPLAGAASGPRTAAFALLFHGPVAVVLPQATYRLETADLAAFELFIVPLGPDGQGMRYEAIFN